MNTNLPLILAITLLIAGQSFAWDHDYKQYNAFLKKYVVQKGPQTLVKYKAIKQAKQDILPLVEAFSGVTKAQYDQFTEKHPENNQKLAFLINSYNLFTIWLIVKSKDVKSITDLNPSFLKKIWKVGFFTFLGQKDQNLDYIEHGVIRKKFAEPRIHFAVNCASIGCPSLAPEAFTATNMESLLDKMTKNFLTNTAKNRIDVAKKTLYLSMIFTWYEEDFNKKSKAVYRFVADYIAPNEQVKTSILNDEYKLRELDYDWSLNTAD